jgi:CheY-like chemotaxis protein
MARILVLEDDPTFQRMMTIFLLRAGHQVVEVDTGQPALSLLEKDLTFDMLIADWHLPKLANIEVIAYLKQVYPQLSVIVVSADKRLPNKARRLGADHYLLKPFTAQELINLIDAILQAV